MSDDEDIILSELSDDDLVLQMHDDLYDGLTEEIAEGTQILLDRGWSAETGFYSSLKCCLLQMR
jgi:5-methyltetrahydrofolate--homocysteine methyltransferase